MSFRGDERAATGRGEPGWEMRGLVKKALNKIVFSHDPLLVSADIVRCRSILSVLSAALCVFFELGAQCLSRFLERPRSNRTQPPRKCALDASKWESCGCLFI